MTKRACGGKKPGGEEREGGEREWERQRLKKTPLEMVWGDCVGSLLLGNECAAVEVSAYFCHLSFQGPDWQLFLEPESHSLLNRMSREKEERRGVVAVLVGGGA